MCVCVCECACVCVCVCVCVYVCVGVFAVDQWWSFKSSAEIAAAEKSLQRFSLTLPRLLSLPENNNDNKTDF